MMESFQDCYERIFSGFVGFASGFGWFVMGEALLRCITGQFLTPGLSSRFHGRQGGGISPTIVVC